MDLGQCLLYGVLLSVKTSTPPSRSAPLRFCAAPRCSARVPRGYCPTHQPTRLETRRPTDPRYGSQQWRRYSRQRLADYPYCVVCDQLAEVTDHIVPVTEAPDRFDDPVNHRSLCRRCNALEAARRR